jgi:hypothetical protein
MRQRERAEELRPIFAELEGKSARETARVLNKRKIATPTGKPWSAVTVHWRSRTETASRSSGRKTRCGEPLKRFATADLTTSSR